MGRLKLRWVAATKAGALERRDGEGFIVGGRYAGFKIYAPECRKMQQSAFGEPMSAQRPIAVHPGDRP
jgi:hypothetical protein